MKRALLMLVVLLSGCASNSPPSPPPGANADAEFNRLADEFIASHLAWSPQAGTSLGYHEFDGKLTDYSRASLDAELARVKGFEKRMRQFNAQNLSPQAYYDFRILRSSIQKEIFGHEELRDYSEDPMTYADVLDVNIYIKRNFAPLDQRVRSIISILNEAPKVMAAARANLAASLPKPLVETAIDVADGLADFFEKDLVDALKDVKDVRLMAEFKATNDRAVAEIRGYVKYLKEVKLPKANNHFALGRAKYMKMLRYGELIDLTPEQLLDIGLRELHREQQVFAEAAAKIEPGKSPIEVFKAIQKDHPTETSLIPDTAKNLEAIRQFVIDHKIVTVPSQVRAQVTETPSFMRATTFASMDTPGPFETKATEAYYYVTPVEKDWPATQKDEWLTSFNYYTTDVVTIHEAYPGHYVQFLALNASPASRIEKIFDSYAFTEGWAHYTEQMLLDQGFGAGTSRTPTKEDAINAAKFRLAQSDEALLRICRLCVSIKMHCQGMTVDQAAKFFQDNCYYEEKPARSEAMRGTYDPEYLFYTLGKLMILKLREDYRQQEGTAFTLQRFHDEMLRHGAPPIRLLREVMLKDHALWDKVF